MKKKVGIVSCYFKYNYGSMLQAYATQKVLDNMDIDNETINIEQNVDFSRGKRKYYLQQIMNLTFLRSKFGMIKLRFDKKVNKKLGTNIAQREKKYKEFKKHFRLTKPYKTYRELHDRAKKDYSSILVGSDQLWLPVNVVADYYTLNWVPDNINKISYATSFGVSNIPTKYCNLYQKFLKRMNHLSVREQSGVELIKQLTNQNAQLVCDPTLLLTRQEWDDIATKGRIIKEKYIFCYFLGKNIAHRKFAERLKKKTGYKIVSLNHADEYVKYSDTFADETPYDIGPSEFLNLIKNAEYICTDSFHGTIFSIIYNKLFFTFRRYSDQNKIISTNSRIDSLLFLVNINQNRILSGTEDISHILSLKIDYHNVNNTLQEIRNSGKNWLIDSLICNDTIDEKPYVQIINKELCTGCTACKSICPKGAIEMVPDEEGFLYPMVQEDKCVKCGLCKRTCPVLEKLKDNHNVQKGYIFQNSNEKVRRKSTSGGGVCSDSRIYSRK